MVRVRPAYNAEVSENALNKKTAITAEERKVVSTTAKDLTTTKTRIELERSIPKKTMPTAVDNTKPIVIENSPKTRTRVKVELPNTNVPKTNRDNQYGNMAEAEKFIKPFDLSHYKVKHVPESQDGTNNCALIARLNQQAILEGTKNQNGVLFGNARDKIELFQKLYIQSGKQPGQSIKVMESFGDGKNKLVEFTWLHNDENIINVGTGFQVEKLLRNSMGNVTSSSPLMWEMYIDTAHKHRVSIVYGTDTYTPIARVATGKKDSQGRMIYKTIIGAPETVTGFRCIDTLRGPGVAGNGTMKHGKVPLDVYFNSSNKFYFRSEGARYKDLYLRTGAPIGFEPRGSTWNKPKGKI